MYSHSGMDFLIMCDMQQLVWSWRWVYTDKSNFELIFLCPFRGFITRPVGVFQRGAQVEAGDPGRTGPHLVSRPVHGVPVLLAPPTLHPPRRPADARGSASGDGTPSTLTSSGVMWSTDGHDRASRYSDWWTTTTKRSNPVETSSKTDVIYYECAS